jgi:benzoate membrane transport protein
MAAWTSGWFYLVLALFSTALVAFIGVAPPGVAGAVAGLALLGTLSASLASALSATEGREAPAITFVVAASGLTFFGIGAAFWALAAGLLVRAVIPREPKAPSATGLRSEELATNDEGRSRLRGAGGERG